MSSDKADHPDYPPDHIKEIVIMTRLKLYNNNHPCSAKFIKKCLIEENVKPLPSLNLISRILKQYGLTHRRTGLY